MLKTRKQRRFATTTGVASASTHDVGAVLQALLSVAREAENTQLVHRRLESRGPRRWVVGELGVCLAGCGVWVGKVDVRSESVDTTRSGLDLGLREVPRVPLLRGVVLLSYSKL